MIKGKRSRRQETVTRISSVLAAVLLLAAGILPEVRAWLEQQLRSQIELTTGSAVATIDVRVSSDEDSVLVINGGLPTGVPAVRLSSDVPEASLVLTVRNPGGQAPAFFRLSFGLTADGGGAEACPAASPAVLVSAYTAAGDTAVLLEEASIFPQGLNEVGEGSLAPGETAQYALSLRAFPDELAALGASGSELVIWLRAECYPQRPHFAGDAETLRALLTDGVRDGDTIALTKDIFLPEELVSHRFFGLALNGCTLDLAGRTLTVDTGDRFGVLDFSSIPDARNAFGKTGRITGGLAFHTPGAALRIPEDFLGASAVGLRLRLYNGAPLRDSDGNLPVKFQASASVKADCYDDVVSARDFLGEGTAGDPYRLQSIGDYKKLETDVNSRAAPDGYAGSHFLLCADLDFTGLGPVPPIGGSGGTAFRGCFDGGAHRLTGLDIAAAEGSAGVFGAVEDGSVQFLIKQGGTVSAFGGEAGGIVGTALSGAFVRACVQTGTVSGAASGGIAGGCEMGAAIVSCYTVGAADVTGRLEESESVQNCFRLDGGGGGASAGELVERLNRTAPFAFFPGESDPVLRGSSRWESPENHPTAGESDYRVAEDTVPSPWSVTASP